ncbi:MAG: ATP-grasp domain-containing protein [Lachnospiraceae bacterium]|nr:ATP-grasp domain-containing protein [Lachnospiraceae bacterium]
MEVKTGWLIYDREGAKRNKIYIQMHIEEGEKLGIKILLKYAEELSFGVLDNKMILLEKGKKAEYPDFIICRTIQPKLSFYLEQCKLKVFNNAKVAEICNDKAKTYAYLAGKGIPLIESTFLENKIFASSLEKIPYGSVIKGVDGHGGNQVVLWNEDVDKEEVLNKIGNSDVIVQKFTGQAKQDVRVYVIGNRIIAAIKRTAKEGFRSNYSLGGKVEEYQLSEKEKQLVQKVIGEFSFGLAGIDFLIGDSGEFILNEIEDVVGARMLYECTNINLVKEYLLFILNSYL